MAQVPKYQLHQIVVGASLCHTVSFNFNEYHEIYFSEKKFINILQEEHKFYIHQFLWQRVIPLGNQRHLQCLFRHYHYYHFLRTVLEVTKIRLTTCRLNHFQMTVSLYTCSGAWMSSHYFFKYLHILVALGWLAWWIILKHIQMLPQSWSSLMHVPNFSCFLLGCECVRESWTDLKIMSKSKMWPPRGQESKLVISGSRISDRKLPRTPDEYATLIRKTYATASNQGHEPNLVMPGQYIIDRKLPRTPGEYAESFRKTHTLVFPRNANNDMNTSMRNSNPKIPTDTKKTSGSRPLEGHTNNQLEPSCTLIGPLALANYSNSTNAEFSVYNEGTDGCAPYAELQFDNHDHVNQQNVLPSELLPSALSVSSSDNTKSGYEKLNPETMDTFQGFGNYGGTQDHVNQKNIIPTTFSSGVGHVTSTYSKNCGYEKLNPETMEKFHGFSNPGDTQDHVSMQNILPAEFLLIACRATSSDNDRNGYEKLNPDTMEGFEGFGNTSKTRDHASQKGHLTNNLRTTCLPCHKFKHRDIWLWKTKSGNGGEFSRFWQNGEDE